MENLKLDNQLCFPVYALSRQITALYRPYLEKLGLTYPQYLVMLVLWEKEKATVKELGQSLWLDSGTLTPLLKRMEENGMVSRTRSEMDERVVNVNITAKGQALKAEAAAIPEKMMVHFGSNEQEILQLREQLKLILAATSAECKQ
ncbi:MarR family winged helix-turn-helix transcriptional regulator [Flavobacterium sp. '19STA2R22 D10 B1']|uniref:MarR family winged helix-turn-helix transcriptional regulator n=1 Tax=Flavobacterium aerium TaxID=3037261 RepID=UPI00278C7359|nr:MarR family transcriptional regulator [Flavobacterium sp. '19STA2R22 D10 B1']